MKESREIVPRPVGEPLELERPFDAQFTGPGRYPSYRGTFAPEGLQMMDYWRAIRKRIWLVVGVAVLITTITAIYMARQPNVFIATAIVQVDSEQNNPDLLTTERQKVLSSDPSYFNTQLQLLTNDTLLRRVVKEHNLDTNKAFQKMKETGSSSTLRSILATIGLASSDTERTVTAEELTGANSTLVSADEIQDAVRLAPFVDVLKKNLSVEPVRDSRMTVKDTRLIDVSFRSPDAQLAAFVANGIGETFTNFNQERRFGTNRKTSDFLTKRINDLQAEIKSSEMQLVELKKSTGILKTEGDQTIVLDRLSGLNKQMLEAENVRKNAEAEYNAARSSSDNLSSLAEAASARYITERENYVVAARNETLKKIADLAANRNKLLQEFKETAPEIKEIDSQIQSLEASIEKLVSKNNEDIKAYRERTSKTLIDNLRTRYLQAKEQEDKIRASFDSQYNQAQGQNSDAVQLKLLEQKIETARGFLDDLVKQQSANDVASQGTDNNISVAGFAIPPEQPIGPRRLMTVLAALFLSTLFGMGLALIMEYLDDTIRSTEEIENFLQLPALAAIPTIDSIPKRKLLLVGGSGSTEEEIDRANSELLLYADSRSSLAEAYRQLRTSILLSTAGHAPKSLLITSSLPSEGKTTTATNTAISLAQTGASVLLIDADMRRPRLHSVFNTTNGEGLSTLLSTEFTDADIKRVVKTDGRTKLNILTSGPIPPNPAELIGSDQMAKLLTRLQDHFTHIVVDSPPIASFTDGVLIASMVDGVILVVHAGKSSRQVVRRSRQLLQDLGAKILGVVLNNISLRGQDNYYYYQSYYDRASYEAMEDDEGEQK